MIHNWNNEEVTLLYKRIISMEGNIKENASNFSDLNQKLKELKIIQGRHQAWLEICDSAIKSLRNQNQTVKQAEPKPFSFKDLFRWKQ